MNVTGIIAEYNPFHNGHAYHLKQTRELTQADFLIVVMGGNFMQRGEPAIVDKYARTKMALLGGADLVIELPTAFATGSAEYFAEGAVELLDKARIVNAVSFGTEEGDLSLLSDAARILLEEPDSYRTVLQKKLREGISFPKAREEALAAAMCLSQKAAEALFSLPNNILGIEYLKALQRRNSSIIPYTVPRMGGYHDSSLEQSTGYASASAIRKELLEAERRRAAADFVRPEFDRSSASSEIASSDLTSGIPAALLHQLPEASIRVLLESHPFVTLEDFAGALHYRLLAAKDPLEFSVHLDVSEDLSRRIFSLRHQFSGYNAFLDLVKTRQYTRTRIARALLHILLDIRSAEVKMPSCLRVLGFRRQAAPLLTELKEKSELPLVTKIAGRSELSGELAASTLYHLGRPYSESSQSLVMI